MPDYAKGQIYMIWSPNTDQVYVGSTTQPLHKRFYEHHHKDYKKCSAYKVIDCGGAKIELIEDYPCASRKELTRREGQIMRAHNCVNQQVAGRTQKEWEQDNKEHRKAYRDNNKEKIAQRDKTYYEKNKEKCAEYRKGWDQRNRERRNELAKERRERIRQENAAAAHTEDAAKDEP